MNALSVKMIWSERLMKRGMGMWSSDYNHAVSSQYPASLSSLNLIYFHEKAT